MSLSLSLSQSCLTDFSGVGPAFKELRQVIHPLLSHDVGVEWVPPSVGGCG